MLKKDGLGSFHDKYYFFKATRPTLRPLWMTLLENEAALLLTVAIAR